ncbi:type VI secretion system protein TssA [Desulfonema magnum]|uniref:Type VI secretion system protein domain-containing protein, ImpA-like n=1 Tax=Desulfonema magnum TaxID=45655 RepID=A0A975BI71_9BACT|nr:type VI secretion system protein TssA [Desulfonema magnum]QTA85775.1 Type VI secretion system protein domain-containing protein, ImpA-like [Desulfonema magnum]
MNTYSKESVLSESGDKDALYLEIERLLHPISEAEPSGENLRYEGTYDKIKDARREDDPILSREIHEPKELKKADWNSVKDICFNALETRSKDLQLAAWLLEAFLHLYGFAGVREGLRLMVGLCEKFWDTIHPEIVGDDLEWRLSPFIWMNKTLSLKLKFKPMTMPHSEDSPSYTFADWESTGIWEKLNGGKGETAPKRAMPRVSREQFLGSVSLTSGSFYARQFKELNDCLSLLTTLERFLEERCGKEAPSLNEFKDTLEGIQRLADKFLGEKPSDITESDISLDSEDMEIHTEQDADGKQAAVPSAIRNRADAYRMLSMAADYLLIHEPHSPTPYLVKRAVSWGNMTLTELLRELVNDEHDLQQIFKLLGLKVAEK